MHADVSPARLQMPGFEFDVERAELLNSGGTTVYLRPQVRSVLQCLARQPGGLVSKDDLLHHVWPEVVVTEDSLVQCIAELRRVLHDETHRIVQTEPRRGYRLVAAAATAPEPAGKSNPTSFQQDIRFAISQDGTRIAYATSGRGLALVRTSHWMTHLDWDWRSATMGPRLQELARSFRLVRYDGRGYGLSDRDAAPATLDQRVQDLEAVVECAALNRFALLGFSGGAGAAIRYAARHPQRVFALVLLGAYARGLLRRSAGKAGLANFNAMLRLIEDGWARDNPAFRQLMTTLQWPGANQQQMQSFNELQRVSCSPRTAVELLRRDAEFDVSEDLLAVRCPTLVLHSPNDARVPFEEGRRIASAIAGARLESFDSPNHAPLNTEPAHAAVKRLTDNFLRQADATGAESAKRPHHHVALQAIDGGLEAGTDSTSLRRAS